MQEVSKRVKIGISFLDGICDLLANFEESMNWLEKISIDNLRMDSCGSCVIGQLFGEYTEIYKLVDIYMPTKMTEEEIEDFARLCGFVVYDPPIGCGNYSERITEEFQQLELEWKKQIESLRQTKEESL